jgi:hypothetical protein
MHISRFLTLWPTLMPYLSASSTIVDFGRILIVIFWPALKFDKDVYGHPSPVPTYITDLQISL